uniref:FAD/NAD(P)-binding domain-containing protein n=1 Tax=Aegilops tauschii TaxID=37682 RepID=M8C8K3_AEGTA
MLRCDGDRVVIVGGGIAGALLAKTLQNHADVVLIDPKEYFEIPWANVRAKVEPTVVERTVIPHADYLTDAKVVTASAVGVDDSVVLTSIGRTVGYDFLHLRVGRLKNVFAIGDITDVPEAKQGYLAQRHAMVVSRNLRLLLRSAGPEHKLHRYKASKAAITVTLGRRDAVSELPFMSLIGHIPGVVKPRDLYVSRTRRMMGIKGKNGES